MQLQDALVQIAAIRQQMARTEVFRGYRAATTAFSGGVAMVGCVIQHLWLRQTVEAALILWASAALLCMLVVGLEMTIRCRRLRSPLQTELTLLAVEQFLPSLVAGGLLTFVLVRYAPDEIWLLPGLYAVFFGLGVFASRRVLPKAVLIVGCWYLLSGLACIVATAPGATQLFDWQMGITFGIGQLLAAGILYWTLERDDAVQETN